MARQTVFHWKHATAKAPSPLPTVRSSPRFDDDYIDQMRDRVAAFDRATGLDKQTGAAGGLSATIREGVLAGRQLNVIFKQLYKNDPEKRAAWATALPHRTRRRERQEKGEGKNQRPRRAQTLKKISAALFRRGKSPATAREGARSSADPPSRN
jgi:hypothetical protein